VEERRLIYSSFQQGSANSQDFQADIGLCELNLSPSCGKIASVASVAPKIANGDAIGEVNPMAPTRQEHLASVYYFPAVQTTTKTVFTTQ
jgi:hypothetical protein